jgi:hypothetical protein
MEKDVVERRHKFIINEELPEEIQIMNLRLHWEEDHIKSYKYPRMFAIKRPTWEVNPTRKIDDFKIAFLD